MKMSDEFLRLNKKKLDAAGVPTPMLIEELHDTKETKRLEKELQKLCEQWLTLHGYCRLNAENICAGTDKGYFGHIPATKARGNMFLLDLLILGPGYKFLQVELKNPGPSPRFQPGQREMIDQGYGVLVQSFDEFVDAIEKWEYANGQP